MMNPTLRNLATGIFVAVAGIGLLGCKSLNKPASAGFASVRIQGHTAEQIRAASVVVFQQDGYTALEGKRSEMVFEKEGSRWDQIAYGSWVNEAPVWLRAKVTMVPLSDDTFRLQCQAYKVRNKGDPLAEDQVRIGNSHRKPYQALLDEVLAQLKR
jgi:hypothetical protein